MLINWEDFAAGWFGGIAGLVVGHPLDTVKVRQQTLSVNFMTACRRTYMHEGVFGFYKGLLLPLLMVGPSNAIFFGIYGNCMHKMQSEGGWSEPHLSKKRVNTENPKWMEQVFWAGCVAGSAQVLATCPVEVVKTSLQVNTEGKGNWKAHYETPYVGMWKNTKSIFRERGVLGLYRGLLPMLYRDVATSGIYTLTYEVIVRRCLPFTYCNELSRQILAGGCAGITSWILVIPFDVVKSRMQADNPDKPIYRGMSDCFVKSYRAEGLRVFTKGAFVVCLRAFPVNAATFVGYEKFLVAINKIKS